MANEFKDKDVLPPNPAKRPSETESDPVFDRDRHRDAAKERKNQEVAALKPDTDPTLVGVKSGVLQIHLDSADGPAVDVDASGRPFSVTVGGVVYVQSAIEANAKGEKVWVYRSDLYAKR